MDIDPSKIDNIWLDYVTQHKMRNNISEKTLFPAQNKKKHYNAIENAGNIEIIYDLSYYVISLVNGINRFKISIPLDLSDDLDFKLTGIGIIPRIFTGAKFRVKSNIDNDFDTDLESVILSCIKIYPDLLIELQQDTDKKQKVLGLKTTRLPGDIVQIESLRKLMIMLYDFISSK